MRLIKAIAALSIAALLNGCVVKDEPEVVPGSTTVTRETDIVKPPSTSRIDITTPPSSSTTGDGKASTTTTTTGY